MRGKIRLEKISEGLDSIGACWAVRRDKYRDANDPIEDQCRHRCTFHVHPDAANPDWGSVLRFDNLTEIESWISRWRKIDAHQGVLTTAEAAALVNASGGKPITRAGIIAAIRRGQLVAKKRGRDWEVYRRDLDSYLATRNGRGRPPKPRLYIFDMNGTLLMPVPDEDRPPNSPDEQVVYPDVIERLARIRRAGGKIAIASNQGGVAWGIITYEKARALVEDCAKKIGGVDTWRFSPYDERANGVPGSVARFACCGSSRKPNPGMINEIMAEVGVAPSHTVVVGDGPEDRRAAWAAGVKFISARRFFRRKNET